MTHLKWSRFNFLVETSKHQKYLYNSYSNSLIRLEDTLYKNLQSLSRNDGMSNITAFSKEVVFQKVCLGRSLQILQICKYNNSCFQIHTPRRVDLIFVL